MSDKTKSDPVAGLFSALVVLFLFGFFIGLPVFVWALLIAAFVGLFRATVNRRAAEKAERVTEPRRPWDTKE